ncbi:MAG TPA: AmmeMemoRadiSam system protein A [Vicinamibacterales bacterium]|nr:AmmeMemoRadiSam system protein A [Vicinamibacterales bacterium]
MTNEERIVLLKIARDAIAARIAGEAPPAIVAGSRHAGAFVSIHRHGELRGCIGHIEADRPLAEVVAQCAVSAANFDPRFSAVTADELADAEIELSVLGPLEPIAGPEQIEIGRHGLLVARDARRGLLLPQVATEWKWDAVTFLGQTCRKAGLPITAWKEGAAIWRFEADVFSEAAVRASDR